MDLFSWVEWQRIIRQNSSLNLQTEQIHSDTVICNNVTSRMDSARTLVPCSVHLHLVTRTFWMLPEMPDSHFSAFKLPKCLINIVSWLSTACGFYFPLRAFFVMLSPCMGQCWELEDRRINTSFLGLRWWKSEECFLHSDSQWDWASVAPSGHLYIILLYINSFFLPCLPLPLPYSPAGTTYITS